jgi:hypothetical protein
MKTLAALALFLAEVRAAGPPLGLDLYMPVPEANPFTREKVALRPPAVLRQTPLTRWDVGMCKLL